MKYEQIRNLLDEPFRRLTGLKRQTLWLNEKINRERAGKGTGRGTGLQFRKKFIA